MPNQNNAAWEKYLAEKGWALDGTTYTVLADDLRQYREPRLMAKFDTPDDMPKPLKDNGYTLLPISNGEYVLFAGNIFRSIESCNNQTVFTRKLPFPLRTSLRSSGEMDFLDYAFNTGMLADFANTKDLFLTIRGRERTKGFTFTINGQQVEVDGVQIEVDGGYEAERELLLVEAKIGIPTHFNIRQLYYPYRRFSDLVPQKHVRPIFCMIDDTTGAYSFYECVFTQPTEFNSLDITHCKRYTFEPLPHLNIDDLQDVRYETPKTIAPMAPQADDLSKLLHLLMLIDEGVTSSIDIAHELQFAPRQSDYYSEAAEYLGLIRRLPSKELVERGTHFLQASITERPLFLARLIINSKIFQDVTTLARQRGRCTFEDMKQIVARIPARNKQSRYSGDTLKRRAQTLFAWTKWLADNIGCYEIDPTDPQAFILK